MTPDVALELFQCKYADANVRKLAVTTLEKGLPDEGLFQVCSPVLH